MSSDKDNLMRVPLAFGSLRPAVSFRFETMSLFAWFRFVSFLCHVFAVRFRFARFHIFFKSASVFRFASLFQINSTFRLWFRFSKIFCFRISEFHLGSRSLFAWFRFVSFLCHVLAVRFRFARFH